jgi:hypothetical protein
MHLLIPFASVDDEQARALLPSLLLPNMSALMARLAAGALDIGTAESLSPPHERVQARLLGWDVPDGCAPWAAHGRFMQGKALDGKAWAELTPCFWDVRTAHIQMAAPAGLQLTEQESKEILTAMQPYFTEDGITVEYDSPTRWWASSPLFEGLATASLDRVVGGKTDDWMPEVDAAKPLRRLQNEMQMLLYTHPVNEARAARGALPVNSLWISGAGVLQAAPPALSVTVVRDLAVPALQADWAAWGAAWEKLDATLCQEALRALGKKQPVQITLCGMSHAQSYGPASKPVFEQFLRKFKPMSASNGLMLL